MSALIAFLSSTFFRGVLEEALGFFKAREEFRREKETMLLQMELDEKRAALQAAAETRKAELGMQADTVKFSAMQEIAEIKALAAAQAAANAATGIRWLDAFRGVIRPGTAAIMVIFYVTARGVEMYAAGVYGMNDFDRTILGSVLGWMFADRSIRHMKQ